MHAALLTLACLGQAGGDDSPLTAEAERERFALPPGFSVELVAADPDVSKVVDVAFDDSGRMWAVTAVEYPVDGNETPGAVELYRGGGRDRVLVFDTPTATGRQVPRTFATGLAIPLAVLPTSDGVLVGQGPDVLRLRDTDGDGVADERETVLSGFGIQDSHLMPHRFTRGPGGWIYMAQGAFNYSRVETKGGEVVPFDQCKVGRFRPDGSRFETVGWGLNNVWGFVIDPRGEMFVQEANDLGYPVVPFHLYASYPGIGMHRARPYSPWQPPPADFAMGGTGLSGLAQSEDPAGFPPPWNGVFFVANPIVNRVQAIRVVPDGPRHRLERADDLLVSSDPWFRPIALHFGPDGCLYVVDWYNKIISHNEVSRTDPGRDKTRARIWRIRHESQARRPVPDVAGADDAALLEHLRSRNEWEARAAWHRIVDRRELELAPRLAALARDGEQDVGLRVRAVWCLRGLARLDPELLSALARDPDRNVRREAVGALADGTLPAATRLELVRPACDDADPQVRLAAIRVLDGLDEPAADAVRALVGMIRPPLSGPTVKSQQAGTEILLGEAGERAFERSLLRAALERRPAELLRLLDSPAARELPGESRALALLAVGGREGALRLARLLGERERAPDGEELRLLGEQAGDAEVARALGRLLDDPRTQASVLGLLIDSRDQVDRGELAAPVAAAARALVARAPGPETWRLLVRAASAFAIAGLEPELVARARDPEPTRAERAEVLAALIEVGSRDAELFAELGRGSLPGEELQRLALVALASCEGERAFALLLELWPDAPAAVHRAAARALAGRPEGARRLLAAIEAGDVEPAVLDSVTIEKLGDALGDDPALARALERLPRREVLVLEGDDDDGLDTDLTLAGPFTVETWIRLAPGISNADGILGVRGGADFNFADRRLRVYAGPGRGDVIIAARPIEPETWTHVAVTRDAEGNLAIYRDGELDAARGKPCADTFEGLDVGRTTPDAGTEGLLTEVRIWRVARSAEEIGASFRRVVEADPDLVFRFPDPRADFRTSGGARIERGADVPALLSADEAAEEARLFARYRRLAADPGDPARGRAVFERDCTRCHTVAGEGGAIGPVLDGAGLKGTEALLRALLTPNAALEPGYRTLLVRTRDGTLLDGFLASRDDERLVLRRPELEDLSIPRDEIESAWFDRLSLMPEGLLDALGEDEVRDLLAYLGSLR